MIQYNGYQFSDQSQVDISMSLVYDESDRVVIARRYMITVMTIVVPEPDGSGCKPNTNDGIELIRELLTVPGKGLVLDDIGFGERIEINTSAGGKKDIQSGPKPREIDWKPIGHNRAASIIWHCEAVVSPCDDLFAGLKSLNYSTSFSINRNGFTTKRVVGHLTISQRQFNGQSQDSADDYRDKIQVERMTNSHREQEFTLSPDKSRLDFSIIDTEIESPNAFPAGVVDISAPTRMRIQFPKPSAVVAPFSFDVRLTLEATTPRVRAWEIFNSLYGHRVSELVEDGTNVIVMELTVEEDWFTHQYQFSVRYKVVTDWADMFVKSSLFKAYPVNWGNWSASMDKAQRNRGLGQLAQRRTAANDPLTSFCNQATTSIELQAQEYFRGIASTAALCNEAPSPAFSWIKFDSQLIEATEHSTVFGSTYGNVNVVNTEFDFQSTDSGPTTVVDTTGYEQSISEATPNQRWIWKGHAQRVGYPIPPMGKIKIGNREAKITGKPMIMTRLVGYSFCLPIYEAVWSIGLILLETPENVTQQDNDPTPTNNDLKLYVPGEGFV